MSARFALVGVLCLVLGACGPSTAKAPPPSVEPPKACTMEAKICPDGTAVSRSGPNCEFAACPSPTNSPSGAPLTPNAKPN